MAEAEVEQGTAVDARTASELISGGAQVVDVRGDEEWEGGRIEGARHIRLDQLTQETAGLDRAQPVVFYCRAGNRSELPANAFRASGWEAYHIDGGLTAWAEAGLPLDPADGKVVQRPNLPQP